MIILKEPMDLTYYDLHYIEVPMKAIRTIQALNDAVRPKDKLRNAHLVNLPPQRRRPYDAYKRIRFELEQGKFFLINTDTITPALRDISINDDDTIDFQYKAILTDVFKKRLNWGLTWVRIPRNTQVCRQTPVASSPPAVQTQNVVKKEQHRIYLEVKIENGMDAPEKHKVALFVENSTKAQQAMKQEKEVMSGDTFSRIFSLDPGDQFKAYAIPAYKRDVLDDMNRNRNLSQSECEGRIQPLSLVSTEISNDDVRIHTMTYELEDNRDEIVEAIYRLDTNELLLFTEDELNLIDEEEALVCNSMSALRGALKTGDDTLIERQEDPFSMEGEVISELQQAKEKSIGELVELGVIDKSLDSLPKLTEIERLAGKKRTWIRSDKMKNHWRTYKMDADDRNAKEGWFDTETKKIDFKKLAKAAGSKFEFKFEPKLFDWGVGNDNILERINQKWEASVSNQNTDDAIIGYDVSAEAQVIRFAAMAGASSEVDLEKGTVALQGKAAARLDLAKGEVKGSAVFPANARSQIQVHYNAKLDNGTLEKRTISLGHLQAELEAKLIGSAGASALLATNVLIDSSDGIPKIKGAKTNAKGEVKAFAGARGGCEVNGLLKWADELVEGKPWQELCGIGKKVEGAAGIGAEGSFSFEYDDRAGKFLLRVHAGLVIGLGASGEFLLEVHQKSILTMLHFIYQSLRSVDYRKIDIFGAKGFDAYKGLCLFLITKGVDNIGSIYDSGVGIIEYLEGVLESIEEGWDKEERALETAKQLLDSSNDEFDILLLSPPEVKGVVIYQLLYDAYGWWDDMFDEKGIKRAAIAKILGSMQSGRDYLETMARVNATGDAENHKIDENITLIFNFLRLNKDERIQFESGIGNKGPKVEGPVEYDPYLICQECGIA